MTHVCWLVSRMSFIIKCGLSLHSYNAISSTVALGLHYFYAGSATVKDTTLNPM